MIICKRPVNPDDHWQVALDDHCIVVVVVEEEKPRRKWRKTFEKGKLIGTPTNPPTDR